ncbi:ABC transporter permease/substrate-binding protein [Companilactobacillus sp. DQM5]|uniref:ABC transporter permease/substrate-binding protein n=1 Tax=Companilactobacillus sp. DQM5 TaxID=3463359 RepID=UPI0040585337
MNEIIRTFQTERGQIIKAIFQHIEISLVSIFIAILIAVPLAILLRKHKKIAEIILQITGIFQTIPSLALLGLLIPFVGIGTIPAIIALVVYAILPIFQNSYLGLVSIDPSLNEAAEAFGLTEFKKLVKIQLPLSKNMIISGIRIATVSVVGTATLAALIGAGGLGSYILLGIQTNNNALLIIGAVAAALLAMIFSFLIKLVSKLSLKKIFIILVSLLIVITGTTMFNLEKSDNKNIVIAGKMGSEPEILINMYKDLIQEKSPKTRVILKSNFGGTIFLFNALKTNQIDLYPEFTGTVMESLIKTSKVNHNQDKTYKLAKEGLKKKYSMAYLSPMKYQNGFALVVKKDFAQKYNLKNISDLNNVLYSLKAGFDNDFYHQKDGYKGLKKLYGIRISDIKTLDPSFRYKALIQGKVNIVDGFTTDAEIKEYNLVVLNDDKQMFPPYQGAPLMNQDFANKNPKVVSQLNKLSGKITDADMREMNYQVTVKHKKADVVARQYLIKNNILSH